MLRRFFTDCADSRAEQHPAPVYHARFCFDAQPYILLAAVTSTRFFGISLQAFAIFTAREQILPVSWNATLLCPLGLQSVNFVLLVAF
jgi:hypothetical protein